MKPTGYLGRCPGDGLTVWMRRVLRGAAYSALAIVCSLSIRASAETETVGGVRYSYRVIDGQAEIYDAREASEPLTIPSNLGGYPVTSIGESAFYNSGSFTSVTIPAGVTHIGDWAFWNCGLRSVALPNGVTNIGASAFRGCSGLTSVTIPSNVTSIGAKAFDSCRALETVYVDLGDADRVKRMMSNSGCDVTGLTFVELSGEALPELPADATAADVAVAFMGVADQRVIENITSVEEYETYRQWALGVKGADGTAAGAAAVAASPHAWLSYALDAEVLIDEPLQDGDVKVEAFKATATAGVFDLTVSVKGVAVGGKATAANLAKVVSVVGGETLDNLSAENVEVWFERPAGGKIRFSAGPKGETPPSSFFIKVIILP